TARLKSNAIFFIIALSLRPFVARSTSFLGSNKARGESPPLLCYSTVASGVIPAFSVARSTFVTFEETVVLFSLGRLSCANLLLLIEMETMQEAVNKGRHEERGNTDEDQAG